MSAYNPLSCDDHLGHKRHFEVINLAVGYISRYIYGYIVNSYIPMYSCLYCQEYSYTAMYFLQYSLRPQTFGNLACARKVIWLNCTAMKLWLSGQMHQGKGESLTINWGHSQLAQVLGHEVRSQVKLVSQNSSYNRKSANATDCIHTLPRGGPEMSLALENPSLMMMENDWPTESGK